jgi:hypothetical protein
VAAVVVVDDDDEEEGADVVGCAADVEAMDPVSWWPGSVLIAFAVCCCCIWFFAGVFAVLLGALAARGGTLPFTFPFTDATEFFCSAIAAFFDFVPFACDENEKEILLR